MVKRKKPSLPVQAHKSIASFFQNKHKQTCSRSLSQQQQDPTSQGQASESDKEAKKKEGETNTFKRKHEDVVVLCSQGTGIVWSVSPVKLKSSNHRQSEANAQTLNPLIRLSESCPSGDRKAPKCVEELMYDGEIGLPSQIIAQSDQTDKSRSQNPFSILRSRTPPSQKHKCSTQSSGGSRKQALFSVLKKVENAIAKKKSHKSKNLKSPFVPTPLQGCQVPIKSKDQKTHELPLPSDTCKVTAFRKSQRPDSSVTFNGLASTEGEKNITRTEYLSCIALEIFTAYQAIPKQVCKLQPNEKLVRSIIPASGQEVFLRVKGSWYDSPIEVGQSFNIFNYEIIDEKTYQVSDEKGTLVTSPNIVTTGTRISAATNCIRQAKLDEEISSFGAHPSATYGNMKHELIQRALVHKNCQTDFLTLVIKEIIHKSFDSLCASKIAEEEALKNLTDFIPIVQTFMSKCITSKAQLATSNKGTAATDVPSITEVLDIEDYMTSHKYGLKGIVDVSVRAVTMGKMGQEELSLMPMEIKTGRERFNHRAQLAIYVLLMEEVYKENVNKALMWYTGKGLPTVVSMSTTEKRHIMQARNFLASTLQSGILPTVLNDSNACKRCFQLHNCMGIHKLLENGCMQSSGVGETFQQLTSHISPSYVKYFQKWYRALELEDKRKNKKAMIESTLSFGGCFELLSLEYEKISAPKELKYTYMFKGKNDEGHFSPSLDYANGERIQISSCNQSIVMNGKVHSFEGDILKVSFSQPLKNTEETKMELWYIFKDKRASMISMLKANLLNLFLENDPNVQRLRELIVHKKSTRSAVEVSGGIQVQTHRMNPKQMEAIGTVMEQEDYTLILGTPGSGKTSVIIEIIKQLHAKGQSMLITSHTNTAVDNILMRLIDQDIDFLRVGNQKSVSESIKPYMIGGPKKTVKSLKDYHTLIGNSVIVACTCYNINNSIFQERKFDYCIVDEASQITVPAIIGPLLKCSKYVLVGDNYQLPPLVTSKKAADFGLGRSLFEELSMSNPESVICFNKQYRMSADICSLSSNLIYSGDLKCANEAVASTEMSVHGHCEHESVPRWIQAAIDPRISSLFIDTDRISTSLESCTPLSIYNMEEAKICLGIIEKLISCGVKSSSIGVMSIYNMQVNHLKHQMNLKQLYDVETHTVDKFQGRDKECIILSFVRSNDKGDCGTLLSDWRRINVALTRAKQKLILLGSFKTLSNIPVLDYALRILRDRGQIVQAFS